MPEIWPIRSAGQELRDLVHASQVAAGSWRHPSGEDNRPYGRRCFAIALAGYERRVPSSLEDLRGQATGLVELPLHVAWSGRRVYDVSDDDQRLVLYALLLAEAQREDLEAVRASRIAGQHVAPLAATPGPHARWEWERKLMTTACR